MKYIAKNKKTIIVALALLGATTLFFFPEPETNFVGYLATASLFLVAAMAVARTASPD